MAFFVYLGLIDYNDTAGANADAQSAALADIRINPGFSERSAIDLLLRIRNSIGSALLCASHTAAAIFLYDMWMT